MTEITQRNFGFLIAYALPGLVALVALSGNSSTIRSWLGPATLQGPTVGGFLFSTLAAVAAGMTVNALRWLLLDSLHHQTGLRPPSQNFSNLQPNLAAFEGAVENHYRYYQFYGNTLVALLMLLFDRRALAVIAAAETRTAIVAVSTLSIVFFFASRDALRKYYARTSLILGSLPYRQEHRHDQRVARNAAIRNRQAER